MVNGEWQLKTEAADMVSGSDSRLLFTIYYSLFTLFNPR